MISTKKFIWNWDYHIKWFLLIVFVLEVCITEGSSDCPYGQILHKLKGNALSRCCIPWPYTCPPEYPYTICIEEGSWDSCQKCPQDHIQPNASNLTNPLACYINTPCQSEVMVAVKKPGTEVKYCVCDRSRDYMTIIIGCDRISAHQQCLEGRERKEDGSCGECVKGTFKDWVGPGLCIPITNCKQFGLPESNPLSPDKDSCSVTDNKTVTTGTRTSSSVLTTTQNHPSPSDPVDPVQSRERSDNTAWIVGLCVGMLVLILVVVIGLILYRKRRQIRQRCCTANTPDSSDEREMTALPTRDPNCHFYDEITTDFIRPLPSVPNGAAASNGAVTSNGAVASNGTVTSNGAVASNGAVTSNGAVASNRAVASNGTVTSNGADASIGAVASSGTVASSGCIQQEMIRTNDSTQEGDLVDGVCEEEKKPTARVQPLRRDDPVPGLCLIGDDDYSRVGNNPLRFDSFPYPSGISSGEQDVPDHISQLQPIDFHITGATNISNNRNDEAGDDEAGDEEAGDDEAGDDE